MEKWDIYNQKLEKTGKSCIRGQYKLKENEYHLVVHIWLLTKEGKILLTQRTETKEKDPLKWECTGGSVLKGEIPIEGAIRELKEEIGIELWKEKLHLFRQERREHFHDFFFAYYAVVEEEILHQIHFQDGEVIAKKWVTKEEFEKMYHQGEVVKNIYYITEEYEKLLKKWSSESKQ